MLRKAAMLLAGALAAVLIAAGAGPDHARAVAVGEPLETQVRVMARGTGKGSVEFGLRQIQVDGKWGEIKFPTARFLNPAKIAAGGWARSSAVSVTVSTRLVYVTEDAGDSMATDDSMATHWLNEPWSRDALAVSTVVVTILARGTNDGTGRVEFGIQQRWVGGAWSDLKSGEARFMTPALIADGGWKHATPVKVAVPLWRAENEIARGTQSGDWHARWTTDRKTGYQTVEVVNGYSRRALGCPDAELTLGARRIMLRCVGDWSRGYELEAVVHWNDLGRWLGDDRISEGPYQVRHRIGFTDRVREVDWHFFHLKIDDFDFDDPEVLEEFALRDSARAPDPKQFVDDLMWGAARGQGETVILQSTGRTLVFNLAGLTSVVRHLDRCYKRPPVQAGYGS